MLRSLSALLLSVAVQLHCTLACIDRALAEDRSSVLPNGIVRGIAAHDALPALAAIVLQEQTAEEQVLAVVCSGTLIAADVILTAGHCIENYGPQQAPQGTHRAWFVSFDADLSGLSEPPLELPADAVPVRSTLVHPEFSVRENYRVGLGPSHDVGLLWLANAVDGRKPSRLLPPEAVDALRVGADVLIAGYGWRDADGFAGDPSNGPGLKMYGHSKILEVDVHELRVGRPTPIHSQDELSLADTCEGDSGGPMLMTWRGEFVIGGVVSRGYDLNARCDTAGVEMRVDVVRPWLLEQLGIARPELDEAAKTCAIGVGRAKDARSSAFGGSVLIFVALLRGRRWLSKRGRTSRVLGDNCSTRRS
jgi:hypothetical protein